jgi:hypothetical protein
LITWVNITRDTMRCTYCLYAKVAPKRCAYLIEENLVKPCCSICYAINSHYSNAELEIIKKEEDRKERGNCVAVVYIKLD